MKRAGGEGPGALATGTLPPAPDPPGRRLLLAPRTLVPGEERERCTTVPAHGMTARIHRIELQGSQGLHHAIVYAARGPFVEGERDCFGLPEGSMALEDLPSLIFASSTQVHRQSFELPERVALDLSGVTHFIINHHFLNATSEPLDASLTIDLHALPEGAESVPARTFSFGAVTGIDVPARGRQRLTTTCRFLTEVNLISLTPHMHQAGIEFSVRRHDGQAPSEVLASTANWSNPETTLLSPPLELTAGQGLTFTCAWQNNSDQPLRFGPRASDEMCFVFGYYYPATSDLLRLDATGCLREN